MSAVPHVPAPAPRLAVIAAIPPAGDTVSQGVREAVADLDVQALASVIHDARWDQGRSASSWVPFSDELAGSKAYCVRIANAVQMHLLAALAPPADSGGVADELGATPLSPAQGVREADLGFGEDDRLAEIFRRWSGQQRTPTPLSIFRAGYAQAIFDEHEAALAPPADSDGEDATPTASAPVERREALTIPVVNPPYAEEHPLLAPIIAKRAKAAATFTPEFSGQRGQDFDRGLLCAFEAVNGTLQTMANALATPPAGDTVSREEEFNRGVLVAVSELINCWGASTETAHLLGMIDADVAMVERMDFGDYDREPLLAALRALPGSPEGDAK